MVGVGSKQHLLEIVRSTLERYSMVDHGGGVVVGVSGGPDSVAMLHLLNALKSEMSFWIVVAHLDHKLRARSFDDAEFVRSMTERMGIRAEFNSVDVRNLASEKGVSVEEAGRRARYAFFEKVRTAVGARVIATAHHKDDELETFFLRIFRGSSLTGLRGIPPVRGKIVRPLIRARRMEILRYLEDEAIPYNIDPTNLGTDTDRNFIRNRLFPIIREGFPGFRNPLGRTLDLVGEEEDFLNDEATRLYASAVSLIETGMELKIADLDDAPPVLAARVILRALYDLSGPETRWTRRHLDLILETFSGGNPSTRLDLPGGVILRKEYGRLILSKAPLEAPYSLAPITVDGPGTIKVPGTGFSFRIRIHQNRSSLPVFLDGRKQSVFDADNVPFPLTIRSPRPGDMFRPWGMVGTTKLKKVLIDLKVPRRQRSKLPLLVSGGRILWIPGIRRSREARLRPETRRILEVSLV